MRITTHFWLHEVETKPWRHPPLLSSQPLGVLLQAQMVSHRPLHPFKLVFPLMQFVHQRFQARWQRGVGQGCEELGVVGAKGNGFGRLEDRVSDQRHLLEERVCCGLGCYGEICLVNIRVSVSSMF